MVGTKYGADSHSWTGTYASLGPDAALYDPSSSSLSVRLLGLLLGFFPFFFSFLYFLTSGLLALLARSRVILPFT